MLQRFLCLIAFATLCACRTEAAEPAFTDPPRDAAHPARSEVLHIPSGGVEINGLAYIASGDGAHPTLVICHGWPGNEKNLDLAQAVRRAGWNAVTFNYRGSWGSPGKFHFSQVSEDASAVIAYLRRAEVAAKLNVDPQRIAIAGHSMGGWATARAASADPTLLGAILIAAADMGSTGKRPRADVVKAAAANAETLVTSPEKMADELIAQSDSFLIKRTAPGLAKIPLLVLTADDGLAASADALVAAIREQGGTRVQTQHFATDHSWSDSRIALATSIVGWLQTLTAAQTSGAIDPERISQTVKILASDEFEGRAPGTPAETKTVEWLTQRFSEMGLEPGGEHGGWTQAVPLVRTQIGSPTTMSAAVKGKEHALTQNTDIYVSTVRKVDRVSIKSAPIVFVGYGVTAPERQWDDYKKTDLHGKVAVYLVNDPDFYAQPGEPVAGRFGNRRMTYYGRWVYKYEEAARQGAIAALIVHDTEAAGYGWSTVIAPAGENYDIVREKGDERLLLQGWLAGAAATELFKSAGLDLAALSAQARRADFKPVELKSVRFTANLPVTATLAESRNVLAKIPGSKRPDETIMFAAHWDAYGIGPPDAQGRKIRPGANDDALGVAGVLELARAFKAEPQPERTLVFAAWTAEERGLLGSQTYAVKPLYPMEKTVANLTLDILQTAGPAKDVMLVGAGQNELEDDLARAANAQGRVITPESLPERGLFYRADHFPLARQGVPVLLLMGISGAADLREGGREAGNRWLEAYMRCYHQACDAWDPSLDFRGAAQDVELFHTIGKSLANSSRWPQWRADSEFQAVRAKSDAARR